MENSNDQKKNLVVIIKSYNVYRTANVAGAGMDGCCVSLTIYSASGKILLVSTRMKYIFLTKICLVQALTDIDLYFVGSECLVDYLDNPGFDDAQQGEFDRFVGKLQYNLNLDCSMIS